MGFLQANYDKPGAGVRKDAPQKKEFVLFFEIYARKFWNLIQANLIYVLFSLPVLTVGLADAGLTFITRNFARERFAFIWEDYIDQKELETGAAHRHYQFGNQPDSAV